MTYSTTPDNHDIQRHDHTFILTTTIKGSTISYIQSTLTLIQRIKTTILTFKDTIKHIQTYRGYTQQQDTDIMIQTYKDIISITYTDTIIQQQHTEDRTIKQGHGSKREEIQSPQEPGTGRGERRLAATYNSPRSPLQERRVAVCNRGIPPIERQRRGGY